MFVYNVVSPDLWWIKWHWDRIFSEYFGFPLLYRSTNAAYSSFIYVAALTNGQSLGIFQKAVLFRKSGNVG